VEPAGERGHHAEVPRPPRSPHSGSGWSCSPAGRIWPPPAQTSLAATRLSQDRPCQPRQPALPAAEGEPGDAGAADPPTRYRQPGRRRSEHGDAGTAATAPGVSTCRALNPPRSRAATGGAGSAMQPVRRPRGTPLSGDSALRPISSRNNNTITCSSEFKSSRCDSARRGKRFPVTLGN
jgi:hypothetical protein